MPTQANDPTTDTRPWPHPRGSRHFHGPYRSTGGGDKQHRQDGTAHALLHVFAELGDWAPVFLVRAVTGSLRQEDKVHWPMVYRVSAGLVRVVALMLSYII